MGLVRWLTLVPCTRIPCWACAASLSRYSCAARELYLTWASVLVQLWARKNCAALAFPPTCIWRNCCQVQFVSRLVLLTKVRCTPRFRCTAEQSMHINMPYVTDDQVGAFVAQSKQDYGQKHKMQIVTQSSRKWTKKMRELTLLAGWARRRVNTASISCSVGPVALVDDMVNWCCCLLLVNPLQTWFVIWISIVFVAAFCFWFCLCSDPHLTLTHTVVVWQLMLLYLGCCYMDFIADLYNFESIAFGNALNACLHFC